MFLKKNLRASFSLYYILLAKDALFSLVDNLLAFTSVRVKGGKNGFVAWHVA